MLRLYTTGSSLSLDGDRTIEDQDDGHGSKQHREVTDLQATINLGVGGSVYHSALLEYVLSGQFGHSWSEAEGEFISADSTSTSKSRSNTPYEQYNAGVSLLKLKPYVTTLAASRYHTRRDTDLFARSTFDAETRSLDTGYNAGAIPFRFIASHTESRETDTPVPQSDASDVLGFSAANQRRGGGTSLSWQHADTSQHNGDALTSEGHSSSIEAQDAQRLPSLRAMLVSSVSYDKYSQSLNTFGVAPAGVTNPPARQLEYWRAVLSEDLTVQHTDRLSSDYRYVFTRLNSQGAVIDMNQGVASLSHQLYESLRSSLFADYTTMRGEDASSEGYGGGFAEAYSKRLSTWGWLYIGLGSRVRRESRESQGGGTRVIYETVTLSDARVTLLREPVADMGAVVVTDPSHAVRYFEGTDYELIAHQTAVELRRVSGGHIPDGGVVSVNYPTTVQQSDVTATRQDDVSARLNLWQNRLGLSGAYGRLRDIGGGDGASSVVESDQWQVGADSYISLLHYGAEYQEYETDRTSFNRLRFYQNVTYVMSSRSRISVDCSETWVRYPESGDESRLQSYVGRYQTRLTPSLSFDAAAGERIERRDRYGTQEKTQFFGRTSVQYVIGRATFRTSYEYRAFDYDANQTQQHFIYVSMQRAF